MMRFFGTAECHQIFLNGGRAVIVSGIGSVGSPFCICGLLTYYFSLLDSTEFLLVVVLSSVDSTAYIY